MHRGRFKVVKPIHTPHHQNAISRYLALWGTSTHKARIQTCFTNGPQIHQPRQKPVEISAHNFTLGRLALTSPPQARNPRGVLTHTFADLNKIYSHLDR